MTMPAEVTKVEKAYAILQFIDPLTKEINPAKVWFCSHSCRIEFSNLLIAKNKKKGSLVDRFCATSFNKQGQCAHCEK